MAATPWHLSSTRALNAQRFLLLFNIYLIIQHNSSQSYWLHTNLSLLLDSTSFWCRLIHLLMCRLRCPALQFPIWTASRAPVFGPTPTLVADTWHMSTHISQSLLHSYKTIYTIKITATAKTFISLFTCLLLMNFLVTELLVWWWRFADADEVEGLCWRMTTILK